MRFLTRCSSGLQSSEGLSAAENLLSRHPPHMAAAGGLISLLAVDRRAQCLGHVGLPTGFLECHGSWLLPEQESKQLGREQGGNHNAFLKNHTPSLLQYSIH